MLMKRFWSNASRKRDGAIPWPAPTRRCSRPFGASASSWNPWHARGEESSGITLLFQSFGYKNGTPLDADFVFDVRCLPNPYWEQSLRHRSGLEQPVIEYMEQHDEVHEMFEELKRFLQTWLPRFEREDRTYVTVALGCTGGMHRSVYLINRLATHFAGLGYKTQIRHRELK